MRSPRPAGLISLLENSHVHLCPETTGSDGWLRKQTQLVVRASRGLSHKKTPLVHWTMQLLPMSISQRVSSVVSQRTADRNDRATDEFFPYVRAELDAFPP